MNIFGRKRFILDMNKTNNKELQNEIGDLETNEPVDIEYISPPERCLRILDIVDKAGKEISYDEALKKIREIENE